MSDTMQAEIERRVEVEVERREHERIHDERMAALDALIAADIPARVGVLEESDAAQQVTLDALTGGFRDVAQGMQEVGDGQLLAPARRKVAYYAGGAAVGGSGVIVGLIELIRAIL